MFHLGQRCSSFLLGATLVSSAVTGCAVRAVRVYDVDHRDYHNWDGREVGYYNQWTVETHRDRKDFSSLRPEDQQAYWTWRHDHN
jgi:hypothetical protein